MTPILSPPTVSIVVARAVVLAAVMAVPALAVADSKLHPEGAISWQLTAAGNLAASTVTRAGPSVAVGLLWNGWRFETIVATLAPAFTSALVHLEDDSSHHYRWRSSPSLDARIVTSRVVVDTGWLTMGFGVGTGLVAGRAHAFQILDRPPNNRDEVDDPLAGESIPALRLFIPMTLTLDLRLLEPVWLSLRAGVSCVAATWSAEPQTAGSPFWFDASAGLSVVL